MPAGIIYKKGSAQPIYSANPLTNPSFFLNSTKFWPSNYWHHGIYNMHHETNFQISHSLVQRFARFHHPCYIYYVNLGVSCIHLLNTDCLRHRPIVKLTWFHSTKNGFWEKVQCWRQILIVFVLKGRTSSQHSSFIWQLSLAARIVLEFNPRWF